jgi:hypothetical protein
VFGGCALLPARQDFARTHALGGNDERPHFPLLLRNAEDEFHERHICRRPDFTEHRSVALAEWRQLAA